MNWLVEDVSSHTKIFGNYYDRQQYYHREGKQKLLKFCREKQLLKMRTFIQENKDIMANIVQGYTTYQYDIDDYNKLLQEEGLELANLQSNE